MIKSPATTQIERGAYSAIVYKEGDWIRAEDNLGTIISENASATVVLQAALDAISAAGGGKLLQQEGTYTWTAAVTYSASNLEWIGSGLVINDCSGIAGTAGALRIKGTITGTNSALTAEGTKGQKDVTVADASSFTAGDWIRIRSETLFNSGAQHLGELQKIASIAGNVITCEDILAFTYTVADTATVDLLTVYENVTLKKMHFIGNYGESQWHGITLWQVYNVLLEDISVTDGQCYPILVIDAVGFEMRGCCVKDTDQAGLGYGVAISNASRDILIHHNKFYNCRHGITCGGDSLYGIQTNQVYDANTFRYSTQTAGATGPHNTYDGLVISNNIVMNDELTTIAGLNTVVDGNVVYNDKANNGAIYVNTKGKYGIIVGNTITTLGNRDGILIGGGSVFTISGNIIETEDTGHCINGESDGDNISIIGNTLVQTGSVSAVYFGTSGATATVRNFIITGNNIYAAASYAIEFRSNDHNIEHILIGNNRLEAPASVGIGMVHNTGGVGLCTHVKLTNNQITNVVYGIYIYCTDHFTITDNDIDNSTNLGIFVQSGDLGCHSYTIKNNYITDVTNEDILDEMGTGFIYRQHSDLFMDVIVASANAVHAAIVGTGAEQEITTAITNPDVPRNISITNSANSTGDVKIDGVDGKGATVSDTITIVTGGIAYGVVAFASVSKITIPATVANPDTITVGISDKLGLSNIIYASGDVYKVKVNNADDPTIGTVNTTYHTVDCAAINAADDITIWYRSNLNMIS